jgi:hypothetical protein
MPKITPAGPSYYPDGPEQIRETDDPGIMAVARERAVVDERARSADLRAENVRLQKQVDEMSTAERDRAAEQDDRNDDEGPKPSKVAGESDTRGVDAHIQYSDQPQTTTSNAGASEQRWSSARTRTGR